MVNFDDQKNIIDAGLIDQDKVEYKGQDISDNSKPQESKPNLSIQFNFNEENQAF